MGLYTWRTFFNPFALRINHYEEVMVEFEDKPVHTRGDYKVYERAGKYFTCKCGIIIAQTTKVPRCLIESLAHGVEPSGTEKWRYRSAQKAFKDGLKLEAKIVRRLMEQRS